MRNSVDAFTAVGLLFALIADSIPLSIQMQYYTCKEAHLSSFLSPPIALLCDSVLAIAPIQAIPYTNQPSS